MTTSLVDGAHDGQAGLPRRRLLGKREPKSATTLALAASCGLLALAGLFPNITNAYQLYVATGGAIYLIAATQLSILTGQVGIVSVGTSAFALVGAYIATILQIRAHMPYVFCVLLAVVACALLGVLTSPPALRLGAFAVAVITLAYNDVANSVISQFPSITGAGEGLVLPRTSLTATDLWYLTVGIATVGLVLGRNIIRSSLGRQLSTGKLNPTLAQSLGISVNKGRVYTFALAAAAAGLAGTMLALTNGTIATSDFPVSLSILALVMVIAGGEGTSLGPLLGAALFTVIQAFLQQEFGTGGQWPILIYGLFLVVIVAVMPRGIVGGAEDLWRLVGGADRARPGERPDRERRVPIREGKDQEIEGGGDAGSDRSDLAALLAEVGPHESAVLEVEGIHKTLGGVNAVQGASIAVRSGEVVGLIGPNGSGKTTLLNCISGFLSVNSGTVRIDSRNLARAASLRARAGIGRTFQHPVLFTTESAAANVLIGVDRRNDSTWVSAILRTPSFRRKARADEAEARAWLDAVGLGNTGNTSAGKLPPGQQRLLEVARALACRPRFLLMDEPAATLRESEVRDLATMIREAAGSGIGILLVDHNVEFIMSLCDRITVIAAGEVIAAGTPSEIRADAEVINVYLGHGAAERNVGERRVES